MRKSQDIQVSILAAELQCAQSKLAFYIEKAETSVPRELYDAKEVECCRMNGLDFGLYIETVLRRILDGDSDIHAMLPNVITLPNGAQNTSAV